MAAHPRDLPPEGTLLEHPLPRVLLAAWRDAFSGRLEISRERMTKHVLLKEGVPVFVESNLASESLGIQLVDAERITRDEHALVCEHVKQKGVREGAALLELKLLEPKDLFHALRAQVRRRLTDAFAWPDGRFAFSADDSSEEDAQAFRVDPLSVVQQGLATHWSTERMLSDLEQFLARHPVPNERFAALAGRLEAGPETEALLSDLDPKRTFGEAIYRSLSPARLAAAWILAEAGGLDFRDEAPGAQATDREADGPEFEFQFEQRNETAKVVQADRDLTTTVDAKVSPETEGLRKEILEKHERLHELSHYEVLGVAADAPDTVVKRAYFGLAKRIHPDALGRVGLGSLHREANEVFARVAQAHQTLSNPKRRRAYDEQRSQKGASTDANRLAQAETLYRKGEVLIKIGNFAGALEFLGPCVELWPEEADYQCALGWALYKTSPSDPERAREHLRKADALKTDDPVICFRLGVVLRKLGETEQARALLERAKALEERARR